MLLEDGTNIALGTKFREENHGRVMPWYEPANSHAPERWKENWAKLRLRFEKLIDECGPVECVMIQRRIPKSAPVTPDFPLVLHNRRTIRQGNGIRIEPSKLFALDESQLVGLFPFNNVRGEPMLHSDGQPIAFRLGLSHHFVLCPGIVTRPMPDPEITQLAQDGTNLVYQLPSSIANLLWRNLPKGFSRSQNADDCLWYDTLFQLSLLEHPGGHLFANRFDWFENGSIGLEGTGLFPREPREFRGEDQTCEGGYPMAYYARLPDLARASVAAIDILLQMESVPIAPIRKRFRVALSFPGERREFVREVAEFLKKELGRDAVLYDKWFEAEFARLDLDTHLQNLYRNESELVVVFVCADYERKEWPGLEWRGIRDLIKHKHREAIMLVRFDQTEIPGIFSHDGYISVDGRTPEEIGTLILERLAQNGGMPIKGSATEFPTSHACSHNSGNVIGPIGETITNSGCLVLLGNHVFKGQSVKIHSTGMITLRIDSSSAEEDAALRALSPGPFNRTEAIGFSHQNDAFIVRVHRLESESTGAGNLWTVELKCESFTYGGDFASEIGTQGHSADDIATMRARRILLNNPGSLPKNTRMSGHDDIQNAMLDSLITGLNTAFPVKESPMQPLYSRLKNDPASFLRVARLQAMLLLRTSGTIEHLLRLDLGPIHGGKMHVRFRASRRKIYTNKAATIIEFEGECPLE
ncbi:MAG: hypothetical protein JWR26_2409 [Pedosphaera sp.]|nr:hypothetical protein [Pedosphaera sp.]